MKPLPQKQQACLNRFFKGEAGVGGMACRVDAGEGKMVQRRDRNGAAATAAASPQQFFKVMDCSTPPPCRRRAGQQLWGRLCPPCPVAPPNAAALLSPCRRCAGQQLCGCLCPPRPVAPPDAAAPRPLPLHGRQRAGPVAGNRPSRCEMFHMGDDGRGTISAGGVQMGACRACGGQWT